MAERIGRVAVILLLLAAPFLLLGLLPRNQAQFSTANVPGRAIVFGIIARSLTFLATHGGFISLAQMTRAGTAAYVVAVTVDGAVPGILGALPKALTVPPGLLAATLMGLLVGAIAVRARDIYLLMITLALAKVVIRFGGTSIAWFNGYEGIRNVAGARLFGYDFRNPYVFYCVLLTVALLLYGFVLYLVRTPFGLVLRGIRDNARRVAALGDSVPLHRIAASRWSSSASTTPSAAAASSSSAKARTPRPTWRWPARAN